MSSSFGSDDAEGMNLDTIASGKPQHRVAHNANRSQCTMGLVVIEGEMGSGKEEATVWLKRACGNRALRVVSMGMLVEDRAADYSAVARLFRLLVREEFFDDPVRQKLVVETLLRETYPNDQTTREKIAYPTVCHALRVTWPSRFCRVPALAAIQEEDKGNRGGNSPSPSRPVSRAGSSKHTGLGFVGWMKMR